MSSKQSEVQFLASAKQLSENRPAHVRVRTTPDGAVLTIGKSGLTLSTGESAVWVEIVEITSADALALGKWLTETFRPTAST